MPLRCGLVGLPNVGKSSLFNALTHSQCSAENFPFCTLTPNQGQVLMEDLRLQAIAQWARPQRLIPETLHVTDIAGLIEGASKGEGLGNQFLAHIREVDAILHLVRAFRNDEVHHVSGVVDPLSDLEVVELELMLADLDSLERWLEKSKGLKQLRTPEGQRRIAWWASLVEGLNQGHPVRNLAPTPETQAFLQSTPLLTAKPRLVVLNANSETEVGPELRAALNRAVGEEGRDWMWLSVAAENEWAHWTEEEGQEWLAGGVPPSRKPELLQACLRLLGLHTYFTAGVKEVRAWNFPIGARAPQAAGIIHSDFERGFIRAEVMALGDYLQYQGEQGARLAGKLRVEGKQYVVQDGDIIHFRFNV